VTAISAVAFDLDGTLIDSVADIAAATNHCLAAAGLPQHPLAQIRSFVGDGSRALLARASGLRAEDPGLDALLDRFLGYYTEHALVHTRLLPDAREVLDALRGLPLALCTNKPRATTLAVLEGLGIAPYFAAVVAGGDTTQTKPHPAPLRRCAELLGVNVERLVLVGDGPQDVGCARAAGARNIGISEAVIVPLAELRAAGPELVVPLIEVPSVIERWNRG
jgi:phosphoglycolate phosphatase